MENEHSPIGQLVKPVKLATLVSPPSVKFDHTFADAAVVKRPRWSVLGFRLEEGILSGWSRGDGGGKGGV